MDSGEWLKLLHRRLLCIITIRQHRWISLAWTLRARKDSTEFMLVFSFFFIIVLLNNTKAQKVIPDKSASFLNNCIHPKQQDTASRLQRNTAYTCLLAVGYALTFMFRINICTLPTRHYNPSCVNICHTVESTANYTSTFRLCCLCNTFIKIKTRFNDKFEI